MKCPIQTECVIFLDTDSVEVFRLTAVGRFVFLLRGGLCVQGSIHFNLFSLMSSRVFGREGSMGRRFRPYLVIRVGDAGLPDF